MYLPWRNCQFYKIFLFFLKPVLFELFRLVAYTMTACQQLNAKNCTQFILQMYFFSIFTRGW